MSKYGGGLIFCSQNIGQLAPETVSALFTSSIKMVRRVDDDAETKKMARSINVDDAVLRSLAFKDRQYAEWMCYVANEGTVKIRCDFGYLESQPKITETEYQELRNRNRERYCERIIPSFEQKEAQPSTASPSSQAKPKRPQTKPAEPVEPMVEPTEVVERATKRKHSKVAETAQAAEKPPKTPPAAKRMPRKKVPRVDSIGACTKKEEPESFLE
jgi:hypothetical protein